MEKPEAAIIGADSNVFNVLGIAAQALKRDGQRDAAAEMQERVFKAESYDDALCIMLEYVEPVEA